MWNSLDKIQVCSGPVGAWVGRYLGTSVRMKSIPGVFVPQEKTYLAQGDRAGCQADEAPFPAVGVLGQGKLLRQGLDHMFDLHGVVLGHEVPHQPGEEGERGYGTGETRLSLRPGLYRDDLYKRRLGSSSVGRSSQLCCYLGHNCCPTQGFSFSFAVRNSGASLLLGI